MQGIALPTPHISPLATPTAPTRPPFVASPSKAESVALSPVRPPLQKEESAALNPIEKRRQMVASQLAAANPGRLSRNRRLMLEKAAASQAAAAAPVKENAQHPSEPSSSSAKVALDSDACSLQTEPNMADTDVRFTGAPPFERGPTSRPSSASRRPGSRGYGLGSEPVLQGTSGSFPSSPSRALPSPRRPLLAPTSNAPMPCGSGRGPPADLLLKDDLPSDCDPLDRTRPVGAGLSMMAPPSPGGVSQSGYAGAAITSSQMMRSKQFGTPPGTASTAEPFCSTPERFASPAIFSQLVDY